MTITLIYSEGSHIDRSGHNITIEIGDDGGIKEVSRIARNVDPFRPLAYNDYLTFADSPRHAPTEAQRATLAKRWLGDKSELIACPGREVCRWAFAELKPQDVSKRYGDGRTIYLA